MMKPVKKDRDYVPVYQNNALNEFAYLTEGIFRNKCIKDFCDSKGYIRITRNEVLFIFNSIYCQLNGRVQQFLFLLIEEFTKHVPANASDFTVFNNLDITLTFADIAKEFDITLNGAKKLAKMSAEMLQFTTINAHWSDDYRESARSMNLVQDVRYEINKFTKRGQITVTLSNAFARALTGMPIMWYPRALRKIPLKLYPSANSIGMKLAVMANMNYVRNSFVRIKVVNLLKDVTTIPTYEDIGKRQRQTHQRIIDPFIRLMDAFVEYGELSQWHFELNKVVVPREMYSKIRYDDFKEYMVVFKMKNYPEEAHRRAFLKRTLNLNSAKNDNNKSYTQKAFRNSVENNTFFEFGVKSGHEWSESEKQRFFVEREKTLKEAEEMEYFNKKCHVDLVNDDVPF